MSQNGVVLHPVLIICLLVVGFVLLTVFLYHRLKKKFDQGRFVRRDDEKMHVSLSTKDMTKTAETVLAGLGGKENVIGTEADGTRLKVRIHEYDKVDEKKIRSSGVAGIVRPGKDRVQILVGAEADGLKKALDVLL